MCFVRAWNLLSFASAIAPWLSHKMVRGFSPPPRISLTKLFNHLASLVAWVCMMYLASVLKRVITCCFFELQDMVPTPKWNKNPDIECRCFCPAQSASQNPLNKGFLLSSKGKPQILRAS